MTYNEFIQNIIDTRGQWNIPEGEYFEVHHIIPECMGGEGKIYKGKGKRKSKHPNLIWLYAREHFIAHKLLSEEAPDNDKLFYAWYMMAFCKSKNQKRYQITPEEYEELQIKKSKYMSDLFSNIERDEEWCKHISEGQKGIKRGHWYNNGKYSVQAFECPEGFTPGRLQKDIDNIHNKRKANDNYKKSESQKKKLSESIKALEFTWYNNGIESIQVNKGDIIPDGYVKGKIGSQHTEEWKLAQSIKTSAQNLGRHWYNNGIKNIFVLPENVPEGYIPGKVFKHRKSGPRGPYKKHKKVVE